ncbi:MAG: sulfatase-like hydrolase/transferase [Spirochaetales bacterium]|jgi:choline-sulfatase|nr:sulfatase-like hydrolase/transferase [Spirochaetales bacterium]
MSNPAKPNVLFLFSDEHSFRFLGSLSHTYPGLAESVLTPNLDKLAARGALYTDAYCQMPLCTPSRLCVLTGLEVRKAGAWSNASALRPGLETMPMAFSRAGYRTVLVGKMHLGGRRQMGGFDDRPYGDMTGMCGHQVEPIDNLDYANSMRARTEHTGTTGLPETQLQDSIVANETLSWIREHEAKETGSPWFLTAGFSRPHFPLTAPSRWIDYYTRHGVSEPMVPASGDAYNHPMSVGMRKGFLAEQVDNDECMKARRAYFACVSYLDEVIGDLLVRLDADGHLDNTIVVYSSDHGEMAGEHGVWWKNGWYEACTRVPLIISTPESRKRSSPAVCTTPVALIDIFPTLCALSAVAAPQGCDGRDISAGLQKGELEDQPVSCDALVPRWGEGTEFRSVRFRNLKYVRFRNAPPLCFDLGTDPGEQKNLLAGDPPEKHRAAIDRLEKYSEETMDFSMAEEERLHRDGSLHDDFPEILDTGVPADYRNCYCLPDGRLIDAECHLYQPKVALRRAADGLE